jgi:NAD(P)-dependent dehydrogenase (short-subunit alcohol dehydrogenase family)
MKSVLITGTSTGIGRATALRLAALGYRVHAGVRTGADADALRAEEPRLCPVVLDVTDEANAEEVAGALEREQERHPLAAVVNNAGVARGGPVEHLPIGDWRDQLEVNLIGQVILTRATIPLLRATRGRLIFVGSMGGRIATPLMAPYHASKFALEGLAESLRHELWATGIRVTVVEPGGVRDTAIWAKGRAFADELDANLPEGGRDHYAPLISVVRADLDSAEQEGMTSDQVAAVIGRSIEGRYRPRVLVGREARIVGLATRLLPDRARDALLRRLML